ncbi:hypothetical protein MCHI_002377 [Candidatus Magnetoovum chiemensis]|nr:hypothetical protein MCHI_002377 [Candidatus Magnetoovum chiemensis]
MEEILSEDKNKNDSRILRVAVAHIRCWRSWTWIIVQGSKANRKDTAH